MFDLVPTPFGYAFLRGVRQYSGGVVATSGHRLTRIQFSTPMPLEEGVRRATEIIRAAGRPAAALCACELRTPAPFTEAEFTAFNSRYVAALAAAGVAPHGDDSPVARTNVCPAPGLVREPSLHAFCFAEPGGGRVADFVVSGSAEVPEGLGNYHDHVVAPGDVTGEGLLEKARFVLGQLGGRMAGLGVGGAVPQVVQVYSVHDVHAVLAGPVAEFAPHRGVTWHPARPPVAGLEYEMDCRTVGVERLEAAG
ncbi:hypothetical protein FHS43_005495 [Streptosporangium becharense]|uniref:RidA family protein n=1 Tax=Streptosporangium becharense TaxID=1816182 RepID=A0A7W9MDW3_9ACTN|nr:hypothetical protein [Streptosporangium becharense]MBB2914183.1 hypothetical protein [Streptosporangium becharense]MBB5817210.1 hypothetical protein [Streptosporangium becharense]